MFTLYIYKIELKPKFSAKNHPASKNKYAHWTKNTSKNNTYWTKNSLYWTKNRIM